MVTPQVVIDNPPEIAAPIGAYSHVAIVPPGTQLVFLAGQVGIEKNGSIAKGTHNMSRRFVTSPRSLKDETPDRLTW